MIKASRLRKSALPTSCARRKISICATVVPRKLTKAVSFIIAMNSLPAGGMMTRRPLRKNHPAHLVANRSSPSASAASELTVPDGLDATTENLGHICAVVKAQGDHSPGG